MLLLESVQETKRGFRVGFLFGFSGFLGGLYWLYISLHTFGRAPLYIAIPLMLGTVAIMAFYWGLFGWLYVRFFKRFVPGWRLLGLAPAAWLLLDWLRGWVASGFPWLSLGYSQTDSVMAGYAPVIGVFGITYILVLISGALVYALTQRRSRITIAVLIVSVMVVGALLRTVDYTQTKGAPITASLIQGSIPQDQKWKQEQFEPTLRLYRQLTRASLGSDLVIWPEAAIPAFYHQVEPFLDAVESDVKAAGSNILIGIPRHADGSFYNSLVGLGGASHVFYDKRHLVPFGEYFPVPQFVRNWMRLRNLPYSDYEKGSAKQEPIAMAGQQIAITICYEDVFGEEQLYRANEVSLLVNVSNDAWFGDSVAPHQHLQIARLRALEVRRYLLRATNTGVSAIISPYGEVLDTVPQFETKVLSGVVSGRVGLTPYARWGNWFVVLAAVMVVLIASILRPRSAST